MALTRQESIIIGCIVGITVIVVFGLILWYFCSKTKLEKDYDKLDQSPITSDEQEKNNIIDIKLRTTLRYSEEQNLLTNDSIKNDTIYYDEQQDEKTTISGNKSITNTNAENVTNTKQTVDNTGIILVDSTYKLQVTQAQSTKNIEIVEETDTKNTNENDNDALKTAVKIDINHTKDVENVDIIATSNDIDNKQQKHEITDKNIENINANVTVNNSNEITDKNVENIDANVAVNNSNEIAVKKDVIIDENVIDSKDEETVEVVEINDENNANVQDITDRNIENTDVNITVNNSNEIAIKEDVIIDQNSIDSKEEIEVEITDKNIENADNVNSNEIIENDGIDSKKDVEINDENKDNIQNEDKIIMEEKEVVMEINKVQNIGDMNKQIENKNSEEYDHDIDNSDSENDCDVVKPLHGIKIKSKQNTSMLSTTSSTQSVLNMDSKANIFGDRWNNDFEMDENDDNENNND